MKKVRWGLISTARINDKLIPAIRQSKNGELQAVASREMETAQQYASRWDIPHAFGSYQQMLDSGTLDAVYISLPNHLHAEWTINALQAGLHVLCEKPFAPTLEEVDRMIAASRQSGKVLAEAFMYRHHPQTRQVQEWIDSGRLGEINTVRGCFNFRLDRRPDIRLIPEFGGGSLWDVGVYPVSYAQMVFGGPPSQVSAMQRVGDTGVDETFAGVLRYPDGRLAQIACSFHTPFHQSIEITGREGTLDLNRPFNLINKKARVYFIPKNGRTQRLNVPDKELYSGEVEDMHDAILEGKPPLISLEQTRDHVRTVLALYASARCGQSVNL